MDLSLDRWSPVRVGLAASLGLALAFLTMELALGRVSAALPESERSDAWVAIGAAVLLFVLPSRKPERAFLLSWREAERAVPWGVIVLLGGGFSLAKTIESSGLTAWLAGSVAELGALPPIAGVAVLCLGMTFLTELTSNTATSQIVLPLLLAAAPVAGVDPMLWVVPATLSASCAFMMPIATAPNAIASEAGQVSGADMAAAGFVLNLLCVGLATAVAAFLL